MTIDHVMPANSETDQRRFRFGENWRGFLHVVDDSRITDAERSLRTLLGTQDLAGRSFVDVGCGSGLFSLAAVRLGAARVHSLDYDPDSVAATSEIRERHASRTNVWTIEQGSVLDLSYLRNLGQWDVVYSWGVLHHTGQMWQALENVAELVAPAGHLVISIYNDQGTASRRWRQVKQFYNVNWLTKYVTLSSFIPYFVLRGLVADVLRRKNPLARYSNYAREYRGMSVYHNWVDWLGGYPFEVATIERIVQFYAARDFTCERLVPALGWGCNEFVFRRNKAGTTNATLASLEDA